MPSWATRFMPSCFRLRNVAVFLLAGVWEEAWGLYLDRSKTGNGIVDGGVLSNFPIRLIAERDDHTRPIMGNTDPEAARNLGLLIDETLPVPGVTASAKSPRFAAH